MTDDQSCSPFWCRAPIWDPWQFPPLLCLIICRQLQVRWCGAPSLMRVWVCSLQLLLGLASRVFLWSESRATRDHIETRAAWRAWRSVSRSILVSGWVCNLLVQLLLGLARAVALGHKSCRTCYHILLSHLRPPPPNMEGQVPVFIPPLPRNRVAPLALGSLFIASYNLQGYSRDVLIHIHTGLADLPQWRLL
jgi:hypothetical protein